MGENLFNLNNKIYSNNNNLLLEKEKDLSQLINYSKDNLIIKILGNIINKMNYIINENKKKYRFKKEIIFYIYLKNMMN